MAYASASFLQTRPRTTSPGASNSPSFLDPHYLLDPDSSLDYLFSSSGTLNGNGRNDETPPLPVNLNIPSSIRELNYNEIELDHMIGEGSFGTVMRAKWREMNVAIKYFKQYQSPSIPSPHGQPMMMMMMPDERIDKTYFDEFCREIETMARVCNHMFIIQLIGIVKLPQLSVVTIFYENGSLEDLLVLKKKELRIPLDTSTLIRFALETAIGIRHLHLEGVIHRDLAARNLLVDDNLHIRVSDFGFSRMKEVGTTRGYTQSSLGPIRWSAPEAMRKKKYSEASDVFSFGVVLYEIFVQEMPWKDMETVDVVISVCGGERMTIPSTANVPPVIAELMSACWAQIPDVRPLLPSIITTLRELKGSSASSSGEGRSIPQNIFDFQNEAVISTRPPTHPNENNFTSATSTAAITSNTSNNNSSINSNNMEETSNSPSSFSTALSFTSLLSPPPSRGIHRDLSLEIVTEPFQQTWEEYLDSSAAFEKEVSPPMKLQRDTSASSLLSDHEFLILVEQNRLHSWGHEASLRVMYLMLQENHRSSETVDRIIQRFQNIQKDGFHMTIVYFWIQMITFHIELCKQQVAAVFDIDNSPHRTLRYTFSEFMSQPCNEILNDQLLYHKYYSRSVIDNGVKEFRLPDLQPLPSRLSNPVSSTTLSSSSSSSPSTVNRLRLR